MYSGQCSKLLFIAMWQVDTVIDMMNLVDPSKPCTQNYLQKIAICINLQLPIVILKKKSIISDMRHHKKYFYINLQQNRVSRSVKTVRTNIFAKAKNCELHTFAATNSIF